MIKNLKEWMLGLSTVFLAMGCASDKPQQENVGKIKDEIVRNDQAATRRSSQISAQELSKEKDEYILRIQRRLDDLSSDVSKLKSRLAQELAQAKEEVVDASSVISLEEVGDQINQLQARLGDLKEAKVVNWPQIKEKLNTALNALEARYFEARSKIN